MSDREKPDAFERAVAKELARAACCAGVRCARVGWKGTASAAYTDLHAPHAAAELRAALEPEILLRIEVAIKQALR
jgi:hypothetical protein